MIGQAPSEPKFVAECCFLDVGQGSCSIVLLGENRAIVLDCGPRGGFAPVRALAHFGVREILALIVSHNDEDHYGGAAQIIQSFPKQIGNIYFLEDRPVRKTPLLPIIRHELAAGNLLSEPIRLEAEASSGSILYQEPTRQLALHVLFPWMRANIEARESGGRNRTSAVLALQCGRRRIVFGGDLPLEGWRQIRSSLGAPLVCDLLAVPHHGGSLATGQDSDEEHRWLYREAVRCETAYVSVGTNNQWRHPLPVHLTAIHQSGARVVCSQITGRCCDDLEGLRPGLRHPHLPGAALAVETRAHSGRSRHVACAGSLLVEIGPDEVQIVGLDAHQAAVDSLAGRANGHPLCRQSAR